MTKMAPSIKGKNPTSIRIFDIQKQKQNILCIHNNIDYTERPSPKSIIID